MARNAPRRKNSMTRLTLVAVALCFSLGCNGDDSPTSSAPPIPNYTGIWSGSYTITNCTQSGALAVANLCSTLGNTAPFTLNVGQQATTHTVQGTFNLGSIPFTIAPSTVGANGALTFSGTSLNNGITVFVTWTLTSPIVGGLTQVWSSSGLTGQLNLTAVINGGVVKTGSVERGPAPVLRSLDDVVRAMQGQ
jgi:hypothetical protein